MNASQRCCLALLYPSLPTSASSLHPCLLPIHPSLNPPLYLITSIHPSLHRYLYASLFHYFPTYITATLPPFLCDSHLFLPPVFPPPPILTSLLPACVITSLILFPSFYVAKLSSYSVSFILHVHFQSAVCGFKAYHFCTLVTENNIEKSIEACVNTVTSNRTNDMLCNGLMRSLGLPF